MNFPVILRDHDATSPSDVILKIENLTHIYSGRVRALDNVNLNIPYGMYGLLGPNGAGKSTLMRVIATLQSPTSGHIRFKGTDVLKEPAKIRQVLGYLPQEFGVYPRISAEALLEHIAVLKGVGPATVRREQVRELLHRTNLYDVRDRRVASFSGGMRQRFGIAQALLGAPRFLIADEPTAGLDPAERARFHDLLSEIGEKIVIILSTHILEDVAKLCSRLAILFQGRVVAEGETSALVSGLRGRVWQKEVSRAELEELKQSAKLLSIRYHQGLTFAHILGDGRPGEGFQPIDGDLQDLYFAMTEERS
jgi:ABC-2 type transport system ATP-binding protein